MIESAFLGTERYRIICGGNREYYGLVGKVDSVITDPPYGAEVHSKDRAGRNAEGYLSVDKVPFDALTPADMSSLTAFAADHCDGWVLTFCQTEQIAEWQLYGHGRGVRYFRPMIWIKPDAKPNFSGTGPGIGHETIASFWCGPERQSWNGGGQVGVFYHTRNRRTDGGWKHPTEKPVSLMKELVRLFTNPGDIVFDPFMGGGTTGVAALELGRRFIGIERNPEYFAEADRRLREAATPNLIMALDSKMPTLFGQTAFPGRRKNERLRKEKVDADEPTGS